MTAASALSPKFQAFVEALTCFPGVGQRTAQKMALYLLTQSRADGSRLHDALASALESITLCQRCQMLCEASLCDFCQDMSRSREQLCVVHHPQDLLGIEKTGAYKGRYFVLNGYLSPIDGIDGEALGVPKLVQWIEEEPIKELILATSTHGEGELTAHYIRQHLAGKTETITSLAQGVPTGGELEHLDERTVWLALSHRQPFGVE